MTYFLSYTYYIVLGGDLGFDVGYEAEGACRACNLTR
jgi:hypothetical protein